MELPFDINTEPHYHQAHGEGEVCGRFTSRPYINMTFDTRRSVRNRLLRKVG